MNQTSSKPPARKRRYRIDIREVAYHVVDIEAYSPEEAKEIFFGSECPESEWVATTDWDAVRVAEVDELGEDDCVIFDASDLDRGWSYEL